MNIDSFAVDRTNSLFPPIVICSKGYWFPTLSRYKVSILLSSKFTLSCRRQFTVELPQVRIGIPGIKTNESITPSMHFSNL